MESSIYLRIWQNVQAADIYVGVVGPVRTGKSTFIKRFMDLMVMPNIQDEYVLARPEMNCRKAGLEGPS